MGLKWKSGQKLVCLNRLYVKWLCFFHLSIICNTGMDTVADWRTVPLPSIVKQKACKSALQTILIGHAKYEWIKLPEPTKYRIELEVLGQTSSLYKSHTWSLDWGSWQKCLPTMITGTSDWRISIWGAITSLQSDINWNCPYDWRTQIILKLEISIMSWVILEKCF